MDVVVALIHGIPGTGSGVIEGRIAELCRGRCPLLVQAGDAARLMHRSVRCTEAGAAVLAGEADAITLRGIDHDVGGVHLDGRCGPVWRRVPERGGALM